MSSRGDRLAIFMAPTLGLVPGVKEWWNTSIGKYIVEFCDCIKFDIAGNDRFIRHCKCQDVHGVDDVVFWGKRRLCEVRVSELDSVRELLALFIICDG